MAAPHHPAGTAGPILVVDDDEDVLYAITDMLVEEGLETVSAQDSAEAEAAAKARCPSLVLLDYRLGGEDSGELAQRLRAECGERLPIVLVTGEADPAASALRMGVTATLSKPFSVDELLRCVERHRI